MAVLAMGDERALAFLLQPLGRHLAGMPLLQQARSLLGEVVDLLERRAACDWRHDMDAVRAARLHVTRQGELLEQLVNQQGDLDRELEAAIRRIEAGEDEARP